ncbi:DUF6265 family protein [Marinicella rhabdoformis]|uniref:DUF6265 family protein n=1 Tax=Marinicella rhabdoformis TaxID=2580566 RepID=UPI0012AECB36|nr:DUF6265 family protein [Marinicella rhabdoformis]
MEKNQLNVEYVVVHSLYYCCVFLLEIDLKLSKYILLLIVVIAGMASAQDRLTEHTYSLAKDAPMGKGKLADVAWLVGSWQGTAFGSQFEEVWNPASAGSMMGMWKLYDSEKGVNFYELLLLKEQSEGLVLLVKHFSADFVAWEDKADFVTFRLVKVEENAVHFSGLSFYKSEPDKIDGYIVMTQKDGSKTEHKIAYERVK